MTEAAPGPLSDALRDFAAHRPVLVALDFDGALAPLVDDPNASRMLPDARTALEGMAPLAPSVRLALVSGRRLEDLAALADPPAGTWVVGSHGAETGEIEPDGLVTVPRELSLDDATKHRDLITRFEAIAGDYDGAWVETKPMAAVLHTRTAGASDSAEAIERANAVAHDLELPAMHGKDVVEVSVVETSKGESLELLRARVAADVGVTASEVRVFYSGDDTTDEHAFERPGAVDLSVKVGDGTTAAAFRVDEPDDLAALLGQLATLLRV